MTLLDWQLRRLATVHRDRVDYGQGRDDVTVIAYHFWEEAGSDAAFKRIECAVRETWLQCGMMKTVLVLNKATEYVQAFARCFPSVTLQLERSLVPGCIFTMSADMNGKLHSRFSTPYCLVVQNDGFPLRPGLDAFIGKYDFIGAPYVGLQWWKQAVARLTNYHVQNGGFSLRSHAICEAAARYWNEKYHFLGDCTAASEDIFYTGTLIKKERAYRRAFRLATSRESLTFSWDAIVPIPRPETLPFGFHGEKAFDEFFVKGVWRTEEVERTAWMALS